VLVFGILVALALLLGLLSLRGDHSTAAYVIASLA
jgi:hypothetical protein